MTTLCIGLGIANLVTVRGTSKVPVVLAAVQNSFSTLGAVSYSGGSCGVDETNGVISAPGVKKILKVSNTELYVAGCFTNFAGVAEADYIAKWNGASWSGLGSSGDIDAIVHDMVMYKGNVVIAGEFANAGGDATADMVAKWDGSTWSGLSVSCSTQCSNTWGHSNGFGSPRDSSLDYATSLYVRENSDGSADDVLYVGGLFYYGINDGRSGYSIANTQNIAAWDGSSWSSVDDDSDPYASVADTDMVVRDIQMVGSTLFVGSFRLAGVPTSAGVPSSRRLKALMRLSGSSWSNVMTDVSMGTGSGFGVMALAVDGGTLYAGGNFASVNGNATANYVVTISETTGDVAGFEGINPSLVFGSGAVIRSIAVGAGHVFVGGAFYNFGRVSGGVGRLTGTTFVGLGPTSPPIVNALLVDENYDSTADRLFLASSNADIGGVATADGLAVVGLSSTSTLDSVSPSVGVLNTPFLSGTTAYTMSVSGSTESVTFTVYASDSAASITRTNSYGTAAMSSATDTLSVGAGATASVTYTVTSSDGSSSTTYTIAVTRGASPSSSSSSSTSSTTSSIPITTTTVVVRPSTPSVVRNKLISSVALARAAALKVAVGARISLRVGASRASYCKVYGSWVKGTRAGWCWVTVTVTPRTGRAVSKTILLKVT